jgi:GNAT superfamily N-acetyltransferase
MSDAGHYEGLDLRRVEEVGLNALQTQRQLFYDGWLLRVSPGRARRARSVNAYFGSTLPLAQKIAYCERIYEQRDLPVLFRITPFLEPPDLEAALVARGYESFDTTLVQLTRLERPPETPEPEDFEVTAPAADVFADAVALLQESSAAQRNAYFERLKESPLTTRTLLAHRDGRPVGVGTVMLEEGLAGVFSMVTAPDMRRRGVATAILASLLTWAWGKGAAHAYLQVDGGNERALSVYRRFGFTTAYTYHYCGRPGEEHQ